MKPIKFILPVMFFLISSLAPAQSSRTELRTLSVPGSGTWDFNVYLPPGYDKSTERYPVVYLFRGAVDEWLDRSEDGSRNGRNIQTITDDLISQKKMGGIIIVMPGFTAMTGPATDTDYSFILNTLIPHIDQRYRTLPTRWHRAVDGFSLGGLHVVHLLWRNPERFASAGFYDGTTILFDLGVMTAAGEPYFARLRPIQFLFQSAASIPSNQVHNQQLLTLFRNHGIRNTFDDLVLSSSSRHNWWYADEHMIQSLPLHWSKARAAPLNVAFRWISSPTGVSSGTVRLSWSVNPRKEPLMTLIEVSSDAGASWQTLFTATSDSVYDWNTLTAKDGTRYLLRGRVFGDTSYGCAQSSQRFVVDNPGNGPPDVSLETPKNSELISGTYPVTWTAEDPEGKSLQISMWSSSDKGRSWELVANNVPNTGTYNLNTWLLANSASTLLKLVASDGALTAESISAPFEVRNVRVTVGNTKHVAGRGNGSVAVNIVDNTRLTGHSYRVSFDDSATAKTMYSVYDMTSKTYPLRNVSYEGDGREGPSFDGVRIGIFDYASPLPDKDSTRWIKGASTLLQEVTLQVLYFGSDTVKGVPHPADYEFRIADHVVDTSSSFRGAVATPLYFTTWNVTENRRVKVFVNELDGDGRLSRFDEIYILETDRSGRPMMTWTVFFSGGERAALPLPGDVFALRIHKPLQASDIFEFSTTTTGLTNDNGLLPERIELSQNYPNPFNGRTVIRYRLPSAGAVKLAVYDLLGSEICILADGRYAEGTHVVSWDATDLSSGLYFYRLSVDGTTITKKALFLK